MWKPSQKVICPCPCPRSDKRIPVIHIKVPGLEEDLEKLTKLGSEYTEPTICLPETEQKSSKTFVGPYVPSFYILRLADEHPLPGQHVHPPPLWLLIDHTLAVIWSIFSLKKEPALGVGHLEWALGFLLSLKDENGQYAPDVKICIEAIEKRLFAQFLNSSDLIAGKLIPCGLPECVCYDDNLEKETGNGKEQLSTINEETSGPEVALATQTPFICPNAERVPDKSVPVSVTIHSMLKSHNPSVHQLFKAESSTPSEEVFNIARQPPAHSEVTTASRDEVMDFLKQWRAEQISNIEVETTRLHSIEALMTNVDHSMK